MLGGYLVTTAWRVLTFWKEGYASINGGHMRMYCMSSRGQPTRGGPPAWGLGVGLTTPHRIKVTCYEMFQSTSDLDWFSDTT